MDCLCQPKLVEWSRQPAGLGAARRRRLLALPRWLPDTVERRDLGHGKPARFARLLYAVPIRGSATPGHHRRILWWDLRAAPCPARAARRRAWRSRRPPLGDSSGRWLHRLFRQRRLRLGLARHLHLNPRAAGTGRAAQRALGRAERVYRRRAYDWPAAGAALQAVRCRGQGALRGGGRI